MSKTLPGGAAFQYNSSITMRLSMLRPMPLALRYYHRSPLWWAVEFDCKEIGDSALRDALCGYRHKMGLDGRCHVPWHANYVGFRNEDDASLCYLAFC